MTSRPIGLLFHVLKGEFGWGSQIRRLDVGKVVDLSWNRRLFMVFQRDLPYSLRITYAEPKEEMSIAPTYTPKGNGFTIVHETHLTQEITVRLASEEALADEIAQIEQAQQRLDDFADRVGHLIATGQIGDNASRSIRSERPRKLN